MSEKVALPREVAESIEELRRNRWANSGIYSLTTGAFPKYTGHDKEVRTIRTYVRNSALHDKLMEALVNGYTIERTPHEELREYYLHCRNQYARSEVTDDMPRITEYLAKLTAIKNTLRILGITVEGINDTNTSTDAT